MLIRHNFLNPKLTSSKSLFCLSRVQKSKDIQFTVTLDKEKQDVLTVKKL